jgi:spermidine/putrescine transport system substrate-binding protein
MHPKERRSTHNRREFLRRTGGAALGLTAAGSLLSACENTTFSQEDLKTGPGGFPLARPDHKVTLPRWETPIDSGMEPESGGTFTIYNYPDYINPPLLKEFGKKYGVTVNVTPFDDINSGISRLAAGSVSPDVMEMTPDNVDRSVAAKLIKPINLDYVPNLAKNVWPSLVDPFYDGGSRYTVPYTVYGTGIFWRNDLVSQDIASMTQPWDIFWESQQYSGKVAILSEVRETIVMSMLRHGDYDINTEDPKKINDAVSDLKKLYGVCNVKVGDVQYEAVPEGKSVLNQAWSGDIMSGYFYYLPSNVPGKALSFWRPEKGKGPVQNDCWSICATTKKPVLAHLWLDFMLENGNAYSNFVDFNGYQPPLNEIDPDDLVKKGVILPTMRDAVLTEADLGPTSLQECTLTVTGQQLWQTAYSSFLAG